MNDKALNGKVAVVTGGGKGIGFGISSRLAQLGASVVITGREQSALHEAAQEIRSAGGKCEPIPCDVTDLKSVEALAQQVRQKFGVPQIVVNNAGVGVFGTPLVQLAPDQWDTMINTNLRGPFYMIRSFAPMMIENGGGDFINISSLAGKNPVAGGAAYSASKHGLNGLSYSVAEELRQHKIRVTVICPGSTQSELRLPSGRDRSKMMIPDDIAHVVEMVVTQSPQSFASEILIRPTQKP